MYLKFHYSFSGTNQSHMLLPTLHQANMFLNETVRKKLKIDEDKMPYCMSKFGNTSCASLPLTLVVTRRNELQSKPMTILGCAFGVGLSWGSIYFKTNKIVVPELIEI